MSQIEGRAKRFNGAPVDYVLLFDWVTGSRIATVKPDAAGNWTYDHVVDLNCGITYVADGCEPITHGAYHFVVSDSALNITSGYLLFAESSSNYYAPNDVNATLEPTWINNFQQTKDIALINYNYTGLDITSRIETAWETKIINDFSVSWILNIFGYNYLQDGDTHKLTLELLNANNDVIFALKSETTTGRYSALYYGNNIENLVLSGKQDDIGYGATSGDLSFTSSGVTYTNTLDGVHGNKSFYFAVNLLPVVKVRVGGSSSISGSVGGSAGSRILITPKR